MVIVNDHVSHLVYLNICELIMEEKTSLSHEVVCFQMLDFGTSKSKYEVSKSNSNILVETTSFSKTALLQREPFLTMFYTCTINSSPLLVTKSVFMLTII